VSKAEDAQFVLGDGAIRDITRVMVWLEELAKVSSTKHMETAGHFVIRANANSKIITLLW
jgi:hypothetical protein